VHELEIDFIDTKRQHPLGFSAAIFALEFVSERTRAINLQDGSNVTDLRSAPVIWIFHVLECFHEPNEADDIERRKRDRAIVN